jgi:hypothetical protein
MGLQQKNVHKILPTTAKLAAIEYPLVRTAAVNSDHCYVAANK